MAPGKRILPYYVLSLAKVMSDQSKGKSLVSIMFRIFLALFLSLWATLVAAQNEYQARPGDTLRIEVLEDPGLNRAVTILPDGRFSFPFAGSLRAQGQTVGQIERSISNAISSSFASPPTVFVSIQPAFTEPSAPASAVSGNTIDVFFVGEVNNSGKVAVQRGTTLLQAIAISGGVSRFAAIKRIQLRRTDPQTRVQRVTILNYRALANGAVTNDIELRDGDVILVPERRLFE